jgi:hypothetical protein
MPTTDDPRGFTVTITNDGFGIPAEALGGLVLVTVKD